MADGAPQTFDMDARYRELRTLSAAAQANPGEERSHDHDTTPEYEAYAAGLRSLESDIADGDLSTWRAIAEWCKRHEEGLGDAVYPGVHMTEMRWDPEAHTVSEYLLRGIRRSLRAERGLAWDGPEMSSLLSDDQWLKSPLAFFQLLVDLESRQPVLIRRFYPNPLRDRLLEVGYTRDFIEALLPSH